GNGEDDQLIEEPELPTVTDWTEKERLSHERVVIGFYVTGHPLRKYELEHRSFATIHLGETEEMEKLDSVRAVGVITDLSTKIDKKGKTMAFFNLDDFTGSCECLMFASVYEKFGEYVKEESAILLLGKTESSGDAVKVHVDEIIPIEKVKERFTKYVKIIIDKEKYNEEVVRPLKELLNKHQGNFPVMLEVLNVIKGRDLFILKQFRIEPSAKLISAVQNLLGEESIVLLGK
ncbi:MAG: OB-fold nucleic acid binding domain-containing protein, partial [Ignavibacteriaceae bacterium]|nr:OB-fold nucleic acid binding domain-containing protein [Ignavibacteriaceae bacterium]